MIQLILTLAIVGFLVYLIVNFIPMPQPFKMAIYGIVAVCLVLYLMAVFGIADVPMPHLR